MEALLYDSTGVEIGKVNLNDSIFGVEAKEGLIHRLLMLQRSNGRINIAHTKTRGDRAGSTKKLYKQKGTGNARAGARRSPVRKGGGVAFGPRNTVNFSIRMNKKERRLALFSLLSIKAKNSNIKVIDGVNNEDVKTKNMVALFNNVVLGSGVLALLHEDKNILLSARNIKNIKPIEVSYLNPLDLLKYKEIVFTKDSLEKLNEIYK